MSKKLLSTLVAAFAVSKFDGSKTLAQEGAGMDFEALDTEGMPSQVESFKEELMVGGADLEAFAGSNAAMTAALAGAAVVAGGHGVSRSAPAADGATRVPDTSARALPESDVEAFSNVNFANTAAYTFAYNGQTATQDPAIEALFKSVLIPVDKSAANLTFESDMVVSEITRDLTNGSGKFNRVSIAQAYRLGKLNTTANILVPVVNGTKTDAYLDTTNKHTIKHPATGEVIETAPLKIGANVPLMGISQTPGQLAKGVMDGTDIIDSVEITDIYTDISGDKIKLPLGGYNIDNVRERGIDEDMSIDIQIVLGESNPYRINLATATKVDGSDSALKTATNGKSLFANVALVLTGTGNFETDELALYAGEFKLLSVVDANGTEQDLAKDEGKAIADLFAKAAVTGYDHTSFCENQNERRKGDIVNIADTLKQYDIRYKSLIFAPLPMSGDKNKRYERAVKALVRLGHARASEDAIGTLDAHIKGLNNLVKSGADMSTVVTDTITTSAIKPFFQDKAINLATELDSLTGGERTTDIKGIVGGRIARAIQAMGYESNYVTTYRLFHNMQDVKIGVKVICGGNVASFVPDDLMVGSEFVVEKVVGLQSYFDNKVIVVFSDLNVGEAEATPFGYGLRFFSPEVVVEGVSPQGMNGVRTYIYSRHVVTTDTLAVFTLSGIDAAYGKLTQNVSQ